MKDNICIVRINNPKALNAINSQVIDELGQAVDEIEKDDTIDVVILTGEGKSFVAGADISQMSNRMRKKANDLAWKERGYFVNWNS